MTAQAGVLALIDQFLIIAKLEDYDIRAPILRMGRVVAIYRHIPVLVIATANLRDLPRTALFAPLLYQINRVREPADKGRAGAARHVDARRMAARDPSERLGTGTTRQQMGDQSTTFRCPFLKSAKSNHLAATVPTCASDYSRKGTESIMLVPINPRKPA